MKWWARSLLLSFATTQAIDLLASMALLQYFQSVAFTSMESYEIKQSLEYQFQARGYQSGRVLTFFGTNFTYYPDHALQSGLVTGYQLVEPNGALGFSVSGMAVRVEDFAWHHAELREQLALTGADTVLGSAGNDTLSGFEGSDLIIGGAGDDFYRVDPSDTVQEAAGGGVDSIEIARQYYPPPGVPRIYVMPQHVEHLASVLSDWVIVGNAQANRMDGGWPTNTRLEGMDGNDTLIGGMNGITLAGGNGDDYYELHTSSGGPSENPILLEEPGAGYDTVYSVNLGTVQIADHIEKVVLGPLTNGVIGNAQDNLIIREGDGWAYLDGGGGVDTLMGGAGDDTFVVDDLRDVVFDGGGKDLLYAQSSGWTIPAGIEEMALRGPATTGFGTLLGDHLIANPDLSSTVMGFDGNDTLEAAGSQNDLYGGRGDDRLYVRDTHGLVDGEAGWDVASLPYELSQYTITRSGGDILVGAAHLGVPVVLRGVDALHFGIYSPMFDHGVPFILNEHLVKGSVGIGVEGSSAAGALLRSIDSLQDGDGKGELRYQWFDSEAMIEGSTGATHVLTEADMGHDLRLRVQFVDEAGNLETSWSNTFATVSNLQASAAADVLRGNSTSESIEALGGNDTVAGAGGNDTIMGGAGIDCVVFSGDRSEYKLVRQGTDFTVTDKFALRDGTDTLGQAETLRFADHTVDLRMQAGAKTIAASDLKMIEELYVGFFDRIPEAAGLLYWIEQRQMGKELIQIAQEFFEAGRAFNIFDTNGWVSVADNVRAVYANVLQRPTDGPDAPNDAEIQYWLDWLVYNNPLDLNFRTLYSNFGPMVVQMLHDVHAGFEHHPRYGYVADILNNKATLANYYAIEQGLGSNTPAESIAYGKALADLVTPAGYEDAIAFMGIDPIV